MSGSELSASEMKICILAQAQKWVLIHCNYRGEAKMDTVNYQDVWFNPAIQSYYDFL